MEENSSSHMGELQRALFYEVQYRNAIVSNSLSFFDINVTRDLIETDFFIKDKDGMPVSCLEFVGLTAPCSASEFFKKWYDLLIDKSHRKEYIFFNDIITRLEHAFNSGNRNYIVEYWSSSGLNEKIFVSQQFLLTKDEAGDIHALSIIKDYTKPRVREEENHRNELERYAYTDPVTGGYNYIKFKEKLADLNRDGSIISMDLKGFRVVNSICGISKGDEVIKTTWQCIINAIDTNNFELAGHINADQFIIFCPTENEEYLRHLLSKISMVMNLISVELSVPQIRPYFGVARWSPDKKIELAYSEAVAAKKNSRDKAENFSFFNEDDTKRLVDEKKMEEEFEAAIARKDFKIWYQPKFDPLTKHLVGAEALVRWQKPDGTLVSPGIFIPLFERNGMIRILDEYIFRNVCLQLKQWQKMDKVIVPVSINLSRASLYYKNIVQIYKHITEDVGIDCKYVPIEITESAAITNNEIQNIAESFHQHGFLLHMDDFGSGYSSLASLNMMHFDTLKLDKSLIDYIGNFGGDRLLEHTIALAKELGMHVTAEGVESENQVLFLKHMGCDSIQGYYYSKPICAEDFEKKLFFKSDVTDDEKIDYIAKHISAFNQSFIKPALYTLVVNLNNNTFEEKSGSDSWKKDAGLDNLNYDESVIKIAELFVSEEYKEKYLKFMNRQKLIENFCGDEETRMLTYTRTQNGNVQKLRMCQNLFKIDVSDDVWAYITVTRL